MEGWHVSLTIGHKINFEYNMSEYQQKPIIYYCHEDEDTPTFSVNDDVEWA